ncbi:uncharacterized protein LOC110460427 isoform X3 [Mizuhopecten yessoensis]|uniref:uncharacterized protein LOC110460427 isoform X3 n=1 Tax=Mizuhopecten yessoensis TaxID=6573 RepID=UPI000B45DE8A|nr:uncharacterized protein LOC110460427 isoform X3 [Mizuhopecten yessoensis]
MAQTCSKELSQNLQFALEEVVDITREIGDLSMCIVTKLQRPLEETRRDHIRCLVKETWTLFTTINTKVRTVQEILETKLPHDFNIFDTPELEQQVNTFSVTDKHHSTRQESMRAVAPFSVKLPSTLPINVSTPSQTRDLSSSKIIIPKTPIQSTSLPPRAPMNDVKVLVRNVSKADGVENTSLDDVMVRKDIKSYDAEYTSTHGNDFGLATSRSYPTPGMGTTVLNPDLQLMMQTQTAANVQDYEHLVGWMCEQRYTGDGDVDGLIKWLFEVLCEEVLACVKRGFQHLDIFSGEPNFEMADIRPFLLEINEEVKKVKHSQCLPVRGSGPDTILCLDTSESMSGENFRKMTIVANQIIDGIEELENDRELQGNVAVTTFGTQSCVALHLTNDYSQVRSVIDFLVAEGPSTLYRGLSMSIAACIGNYADVSVNDVRLMARVIVLTDGKFSNKDAEDEHFQFDPKNDIMVPSAANLMKFHGIVCYCVHVGASAESELLQILTKTTNGKILPDDNVDELVKMPTHLVVATNLIRQFPDLVDGENDTSENEEATLQALMDLESSTGEAFNRDFSESEKESIIALAMNISKLPLTKVSEQNEYLVQELELELPPVGTRVRRGPDWDPADANDSNGPGTVVCHNNNAVLWDCGIIPLPYHCYDPCQVLSTDNDERAVRDDGWIQVGCKVERGPDWIDGDDDGGRGSCGVVCLCSRKGTLTVRWPSRKIGKYRYGDEVILLDTSEEQAQAAGYYSSISTIEFEPGNTLSSDTQHYSKPYKNVDFSTYFTRISDSNTTFLMPYKFNDHEKTGVASEVQSTQEQERSLIEFQEMPEPDSSTPSWNYQQEGQIEWISFDAGNTRKLESDWSKHRKTSMVSVNNKRYRVAFEKMAMSSIDGNDEEKQLRLHVKRERKNTQGVKDTED